MLERTVADVIEAGGERQLRERAAISERLLADDANAAAERHGCQFCAAVERVVADGFDAVAKRGGPQVCAVIEGGFVDDGGGVGDDNARQAGHAPKCVLADGFDRLAVDLRRDGHGATVARAVGEHAVANAGDAIADLRGLQLGAACEHARADLGHGVGDGGARRGGAAPKRFVADGRELLSTRHFRQSCAAFKRAVTDAGDVASARRGYQLGAALEDARADAGDAAADRHAPQPCASLERAGADALDAVADRDAGYVGAVRKGARADAGDAVGDRDPRHAANVRECVGTNADDLLAGDRVWNLDVATGSPVLGDDAVDHPVVSHGDQPVRIGVTLPEAPPFTVGWEAGHGRGVIDAGEAVAHIKRRAVTNIRRVAQKPHPIEPVLLLERFFPDPLNGSRDHDRRKACHFHKVAGVTVECRSLDAGDSFISSDLPEIVIPNVLGVSPDGGDDDRPDVVAAKFASSFVHVACPRIDCGSPARDVVSPPRTAPGCGVCRDGVVRVGRGEGQPWLEHFEVHRGEGRGGRGLATIKLATIKLARKHLAAENATPTPSRRRLAREYGKNRKPGVASVGHGMF